jgi:D-inositol-3-phosphate glycosyltransferase
MVNSGLRALPVSIIPHGVDTQHFHPLRQERGLQASSENRRTARDKLFAGHPGLRDSFIVLNANRNQPRKRLDITMEAFAMFAQDKPKNVKLYLHMAREDSGWDIQLLAQRLNITDRLLVTTLHNGLPNLSLEHLNLIYNACDVGVNTASAEGWGLVSFEHAATGAPQIVPRHTSPAELWENAAVMVDPSFTLTNERILTRAYYVAPRDVAAALQRLYSDQSYYGTLAEAAFRKATLRHYDWDVIAGQWDRIFTVLHATRSGQDLQERIPSSNELSNLSRKEHSNELALL